jgi:Tfp pilus assembly protein FimT
MVTQGVVVKLKESGFSVMELLVVVTISTAIAASVIPGFTTMRGDLQKNNLKNSFAFDLRRARSEAIAAGTRVILSTSESGAQYELGIDEVPFNADGIPDQIFASKNIQAGFTVSASKKFIFDSRGFLVDLSGEIISDTIMLMHHGQSFYNGTILPIGEYEE